MTFEISKQKSQENTKKFFKPFYDIHENNLKIILKTKDTLIEEFKNSYDTTFNHAFLMLISGLLSNLNMAHYLHYNPDLIKQFIWEHQTEYQDSATFKT